jgi:hypothetical protein
MYARKRLLLLCDLTKLGVAVGHLGLHSAWPWTFDVAGEVQAWLEYLADSLADALPKIGDGTSRHSFARRSAGAPLQHAHQNGEQKEEL